MAAQRLELQFTLATIDEAVQQFWFLAAQYRICAFSGTLGAGKTTFVHSLCNLLGVKDAVSSPTFALINEYHFLKNGIDTTIYHMDWYRLRDAEEAINAGMEDCLLQKDVYNFIEWPEQAPELLTSPYLWITIEALDEQERKMIVEVH